jgi:hypothetical protein
MSAPGLRGNELSHRLQSLRSSISVGETLARLMDLDQGARG